MKLNTSALVTLLSLTSKTAFAATCEESSGVCVCTGQCPSFTDGWVNKGSTTLNSEATCVAAIESSNNTYSKDSVTVDGQTFTEVDPCPGGGEGVGSSAEMFGAGVYYVTVLATAVVGAIAL